MNGARTTLEVRLVHCIGSVLDLEAVYTLMRSTSSVLVSDGAVGRMKELHSEHAQWSHHREREMVAG